MFVRLVVIVSGDAAVGLESTSTAEEVDVSHWAFRIALDGILQLQTVRDVVLPGLPGVRRVAPDMHQSVDETHTSWKSSWKISEAGTAYNFDTIDVDGKTRSAVYVLEKIGRGERI